jgi:hypothetical protein
VVVYRCVALGVYNVAWTTGDAHEKLLIKKCVHCKFERFVPSIIILCFTEVQSSLLCKYLHYYITMCEQCVANGLQTMQCLTPYGPTQNAFLTLLQAWESVCFQMHHMLY